MARRMWAWQNEGDCTEQTAGRCAMTPLPEQMPLVRFEGAGGPEVVRPGLGPTPAPGPGEVLIAVAAAGVNRPDCLQRAGGYPPPPGASDIPGLEVAGEVVAAAAGVAWPRPGDQVAALLSGGGYAAYAVAHASHCLPIPYGLSLLEAAALPETVFTVYDNVVTRGRLAAGERFLVHGGSSGIGSTAIQIAKALGARVVATAGSAEKCAFCRQLGADLAINYREQDFVGVLRDAHPDGVDLILDMVGGDYIQRNLSCLALEGRLMQIAFLGGARAMVDFRPLLMRRLSFGGSTLRPRSVAEKAAIAAAVRREIWPLVEQGRVRPIIDRVFPLNEARAAHERMETSAHMGKIMLALPAAAPDLRA
jgi:putative PIG3 family NAD(P)H quinone oxidoreductase